MIPIAGSVIPTTPVQTPLINTALPGTAVMHVPYDNVAPSVSNGEVNNNARGNSDGTSLEEAEQVAVASAGAAQSSPAGDAANLAPAGQATFIAQLLSQGTPISGLLLEYEKLVSFSNVKYKPSNALKPAPAPAGVFGRILHQEKAVLPPVPVEVPAQPQAEAAPVPMEKIEAPAAAAPVVPVPKAAPAPAEAPVKLPSSIRNVVSQAIDAYAASKARSATIGAEAVTDLA
jgi:hypothetical protein